ncbi:MAG: GNAT family N-acetyltransferase [Actinomycetota bacterium]
MAPVLRRTGPADARAAAPLIFDAIPSIEIVLGDRATALRAVEACYRAPRTELASRFGMVAEWKGKVAGVAIAFPSRLFGSLKLGTGVVLARTAGPRHATELVRRARVLDRILPKVGPDDLYVSILSVGEPHRRRGVGTSLMERVLAGADRLGLGVALHTAMDEPARLLYEGLGFRVVAERETSATERRVVPVSGMLLMDRPRA